ncbi:MAG TPA: ectoine/hydroxyectoine ABC transporter substrate-binding protein EhuB [Gemmatimonadaceae bacterium]|nr:ectoine/hydroxyectoine ABC transporter substrate-binding protein EhuB [Gemmatimonadaceae bacterium]
MHPLLLGAAGIAALLAVLAYRADEPEDTWHRIRRTRTVRIGYAPEAPFAYRTPAGEVTGFDPELARQVFRRRGIDRIEWVQTEFRSLIPELLAGRFDMIAAGMVITPERTTAVAFSRPTFAVPPALLVREGEAARWADLGRLRDDRSASIAVLTGAFEEQVVRAAGIPSARVLRVPDAVTGFESVRSGRVAALALTAPTVQHLAQQGDGLAIVRLQLGDPTVHDTGVARGAFAFRPTDEALRGMVDVELRDLVGSAEHRALARRFGFADADLPSP